MSPKPLIITLKDGVRIIKFNRPEKRNAITGPMYTEMTEILRKDANDDGIVATVFTGAGDYYSSGNDFSLNAEGDEDPLSDEAIKKRIKRVEDFVNALIDYPKLLIAVINGPAIGIAVTSAALFDIVYASEKATFQTPFIHLSLCAEGCSSYLFERIMGRSKANELLLLGHKMTAHEAHRFNFVSEVLAHDKLDELFKRIYKFGKLPVNSIKTTKSLIRAPTRDTLKECNKRECDQLVVCLKSEDFITAMTELFSRKSKL